MFAKVGWTITWLFAPLAGFSVVGVAIFLTLVGYDALLPTALMATASLLLWGVLIWGVARLLSSRLRKVYLAGCALISIGAGGAAVGLPFLAAASGHPPELEFELEKVQ